MLKPRMPKFPPAPAAWVMSGLGALLLLISLLMQFPMWMAVFEFRPVAPGGGEYMVALFFGLPCLLLSTLLLGITTARAIWRSKFSAVCLVFAITFVLGWLGLFLRSLTH